MHQVTRAGQYDIHDNALDKVMPQNTRRILQYPHICCYIGALILNRGAPIAFLDVE